MDAILRQLFTACEHGDVSAVETALSQGVEVDASIDGHITALQAASANGHEAVVRQLLMWGAALDKTNSAGWTALMQAARNGHSNVVMLLLQNKADMNACNRLGASALMLAARGGYVQTVRLLLEAGADWNLSNSNSSCEYTPLLIAAQNGRDAVLRLFLDRGCDVNYHTSSASLMPLMLAALNGHMTTAQILIEHGCDANAVNVDGQTALEVATRRGKREVKGYLDRKTTNKPKIAAEDVKPDIIEAARHGNLDQIRQILVSSVSEHDACSPQDGATPLMFAAMLGRLDITRLLVESGCNLNKQDTISGWTALMQATYHGQKNVAVYLIESGTDVTLQAKNGCTAFDMLSLTDDADTELLRLLAAKTLQVSRPERPKKAWRKMASTSMLALDQTYEDVPRSGLKAWWSRMSNRFRNLKLGRTFALTPNRLNPLEHDFTHPASYTPSIASASTPNTPSPIHRALCESPRVTPASAHDATLNTLERNWTLTTYENMLQETKKSAAMYTLDINPTHSTLTGTETLKPVIPPFLPSPTFALDSNDHSPLSTTGNRSSLLDSTSTLATTGRPSLRPMKFLQNRSHGHFTSTQPTSHSASQELSGELSPESSGGASSLTCITKASSGFGSDQVFVPNNPPAFLRPSRLFMSRSKVVPTAFQAKSNTTSPNSSTSGSSSLTPHRSSQGKSTSSKESTASTLTPSPSPVPKANGKPEPNRHHRLSTESQDDELADILRKLSLEKYQPIFEEQEVDMEAFLTLTDTDLSELGVSHTDSRQQILRTITELNSGKGKERQHFHDTMTSFQSTLHSKLPGSADAESGTGGTGIIYSGNDVPVSHMDLIHVASAKSRSS